MFQISLGLMHSSRFTLRNAKIQKFKTNSYALSTFRETSVILPGTDSPQIGKLLLWALLTFLRFFLYAQNSWCWNRRRKYNIYIQLSLNHCAWLMRSEFSCRLWQLRNKGMQPFMEGPLPSGQTHPTPYLPKEGRGLAGSAAAPLPMFLH